MAGDWLKFEANTPEKQEVLAITIALGFDDPDLTVGKLLKVWRWFDQHTVDGNAVSVTSALLDRLIGVTGITKAMESVGWMIISEHGLTLPNFDRHNGKTAKQRALTARRVANHKALDDGNDDSVSGALPREEKRREDITTSIPNGIDCPQPSAEDKSDPCPHQEIIALYAKHLPMGIQPRTWTGSRAVALKARWREDKKRQSLAWWERFFAYIATSPFLTGKVYDTNRKPFEITLEWIVTPKNFAKIIDGNYHSKEASNA